jgi:AcrR family transcriptional regulator
LLDAALAQLVASGLSAFTTTEVVRRAGVSQGALFKYFPSKAELLAAVAEHLFDQLRARYESAFIALTPAKRNLLGGLALLWEQMLDERLAAAFELYTAARTDKELQARLAPVVRAHVEQIEVFAATLVDLGEPERVRSMTALAIAAIQGLVLNQLALPDASQVKHLRRDLDALGALYLALPRAEARPTNTNQKAVPSRRKTHG